MFRYPVLPRLPDATDGYRLVERLRELFVEYAKIGRQDQCPPTLRRTKDAVQTVTVTSGEKVTFATAGWDTHGYWDATNNRYTPLDYSGYYRVSAKVTFAAQTVSNAGRAVDIRVTGSSFSRVTLQTPTASRLTVLATDLVYLNGSTDYVEVFVVIGEACDIEADDFRTSLAIEYVGADQLI